MKCMMVFVFLTMLLIVGCKDNSTNNPDPTVSDSVFTDIRDGKKYRIVKINSQVWMSENLHVSTYRNGDLIRYARSPEELQDAAQKREGAWCYYDNDPKNVEIYGKLYNWYAVNDSRGLAPTGYHIPSDAEWTVLTDFLGGEDIAGQKMKSKTGWYQNGDVSNSSGFTGLPGGYCNNNGNSNDITVYGYFWSSSENNTNNAWNRSLYYNNTKVYRNTNDLYYGLSVRCLKD